MLPTSGKKPMAVSGTATAARARVTCLGIYLKGKLSPPTTGEMRVGMGTLKQDVFAVPGGVMNGAGAFHHVRSQPFAVAQLCL